MKRLKIVARSSASALVEEIRMRLHQADLEVVEDVEACDALIAIGGDGTILNAAQLALPHRKPVLGINAGRLGYLAGLEPDELELLPRLATGEFRLDRRMLLQVDVIEDERVLTSALCLNDAVISRYGVSYAATVQVNCSQGCRSLTYLGDGVIFATPTGSTAYNFSAGGPVVEPGIESILLTPICNHKALTRTVVFSAQSQFSVDITSHDLALTTDAQPPQPLLPGQRITVCKADCEAQLIRLKPSGFLDILYEKVGGSI